MSNFLSNFAEQARASGGRSGGGGGGGGGGRLRGLAIGGAALLTGAVALSYGAYQSMYTIGAGHKAIMYNRLSGLQKQIIPEGTHFKIPFVETPYVFDVRTKPSTISSPTGTRDLQMVDITLRVLYKPNENFLPEILTRLDTDYADRVLPSIVNETLKSVVAQFNASQLITQREQVSKLIARNLTERAVDFHLVVDDVSITHLNFGKEYRAAVEAKQVAQQEAERAKFIVKQALQDKRSTIIKAEGEAKSAELIGKAVQKNPGYLELRKMEAAAHIAEIVSKGNNVVYLDSNSLMQNSLAKPLVRSPIVEGN